VAVRPAQAAARADRSLVRQSQQRGRFEVRPRISPTSRGRWRSSRRLLARVEANWGLSRPRPRFQHSRRPEADRVPDGVLSPTRTAPSSGAPSACRTSTRR
jgi:hypothetical protein